MDDNIAEWKHIGNDGSVFFPADWLDKTPRDFYGIKVLTSGIRFEYAIKTKVKMLTPEWEVFLMKSDIAAKEAITVGAG